MTAESGDAPRARLVLVLEDEAVVALELEARLRALGYRVAGPVASYDEALAAAEAELPDLLLADVRIAGARDGIQTADALRRQWGVPAVFITAHADAQILKRALASSPSGYLTKPFREPELRAAVEIALQRGALERRLAESEHRLRQLAAQVPDTPEGARRVLRAFPDLIFSLSASGKVLWVHSDRHRDLLIEPAALVGESLESLMPKAQGAQARALLEEALRERRVVSVIAEFPPPFPPQSFEARFVPVSADEALLVVRNVTEQHESERAHKVAQERHHQAQKLDAVGRLAAGIAHDFNNLLTVVLGSGAALELEVANHAEAVRLVREVIDAGERASTLTRQLLAFARVRRAPAGTADTARVLQTFDRVLLGLLGEKIELVEALAPDTWPIHLDSSELEQVVLNLAVNARDAMPGGGRVTISSRNLEAGDSKNLLAGPAVLVEVADTGAGMDEATCRQIFEPYFTTKPVGQSSGLGLSTVYGIVTQAGGEVAVASKLGEGARFALYLPPAPAPALAQRLALDVATTTPLPRGRVETVLLVEDDASVRRVMGRSLQTAGYEVLVTSGGVAALEVIRARRPLDLLVTDFIMPGMSGPQLAREARRLRPTLPVLFVTGYAPDEREIEGLGAMVLKPFARGALETAVRAALKGGD